MAAPLASVILTPNIAGADGISMLSRRIVAAAPAPAMVLSLHDRDGIDLSGTPIRGASGSRGRFCTIVSEHFSRCGAGTVVMCCHVHLAPAARVLARRGARLVIVLCGIEAWTPLRLTERWALGSSEILAISEHTAQRFKAVNPGFRDAEIAVVHPGLPDEPSAAYGNPAHLTSVALIVGRMAAEEGYKGHDVLIDVWPRVLLRYPDAVLCIVGDGTDRARLETKVETAGLTRSIVFKGRVDARTLEGLYRDCRFFVMPSRDEGFGFVFLEAMRAGKACVAGKGAAGEIVRDGETGLIVDPADPDQVSAAAIRLFGDSDACEAFGAAGATRFRSVFTDAAFRGRLSRALHMDVASS